MLKKITYSLFFIFFTLNVNVKGQEISDWRLYKPEKTLEKDTLKAEKSRVGNEQTKTGKIEIIEDERIAQLNRQKKENPTKMDGYRVQIYFGNRNAAQEKRGAFIRANPGVNAYISYLAPNFRLRVGDFRTRLESEKFKYEISKSFPGSYIVKDKIELPPLEVNVVEGEQ